MQCIVSWLILVKLFHHSFPDCAASVSKIYPSMAYGKERTLTESAGRRVEFGSMAAWNITLWQCRWNSSHGGVEASNEVYNSTWEREGLCVYSPTHSLVVRTWHKLLAAQAERFRGESESCIIVSPALLPHGGFEALRSPMETRVMVHCCYLLCSATFLSENVNSGWTDATFVFQSPRTACRRLYTHP